MLWQMNKLLRAALVYTSTDKYYSSTDSSIKTSTIVSKSVINETSSRA